MKRLIVLSLCLLPLVAGCSLFGGDPIPPSPALVGVTGQDAAWNSQIKRQPDGATFEPLVAAREAVEQARNQPQVESFDAQSLADAEQALADAESGWQALEKAKRRPADKLAAVADDAHRAQRLAEIARYTAAREINLQQLLAINDRIEQQQARTAPTGGSAGARMPAGNGDNLVGQRVVPDRLGDIAFQPGTARLTGPSEAVVQRLATLLKNNPDYGIAVFGHTDNVAPSDSSLARFVKANPGLEEQAPTRDQQVRAFNLALSAARARSVARTLVDLGIEARRIGARGFGDTRPVASNDNAEGRRANRRIEAIVVPGPDSQAARQQGGS